MRSISDQLLLMIPALLALLLLALFSAPMSSGGWPLAPNVAWVMTLVVASVYPPAWPRGFAFLIGLLQDILLGTPLGAQGLLTLLLVSLVASQAARQATAPFHLRWLEAAGTLVLWHFLLWLIYHFVAHDAPSLRAMLRMGLVSTLWYPLFYFLLTRIFLLLPPLK